MGGGGQRGKTMENDATLCGFWSSELGQKMEERADWKGAYPLAGDQMGMSEDDRWLVSGKIVISH